MSSILSTFFGPQPKKKPKRKARKMNDRYYQDMMRTLMARPAPGPQQLPPGHGAPGSHPMAYYPPPPVYAAPPAPYQTPYPPQPDGWTYEGNLEDGFRRVPARDHIGWRSAAPAPPPRPRQVRNTTIMDLAFVCLVAFGALCVFWGLLNS